ncbi:hypothetical protein LCGC14_2019560 [marine sediment metagenome]|uniref:Uncharacterized protein n=1 Tax=marine sediment metagenome TaxID=412755 RepID=A0A0F9EY61_9ZZZZ
MTKENGPPVCPTCERNHSPDQFCPRRIARACLNWPGSLEAITDADHQWSTEHPNFKALDVLEETIANYPGD